LVPPKIIMRVTCTFRLTDAGTPDTLSDEPTDMWAEVEADKAPKDLPDYWASIGLDHGGMTDDDLEAAGEINKKWNEALKIALASAKED
jgi:hypothetical protein